MPLPESISHLSRSTLAFPKALCLQSFPGQICFASIPSQTSSRQHHAAHSLWETLEKHTHTLPANTAPRCWSCPCVWLFLLPPSTAKGRSWWQVLQEVDVPLLRAAVCARGQPPSHAECAICFPGFDLAHHFLLRQPVAKLADTSICSESVQLLHRKGCSHQILSRGYKQLPLHLQHSWVIEIPHSDTHKSHPAFLLSWHRALSAPLLVQHISSAQMEAQKISGERRRWWFLLILCQWKHSSSTQHTQIFPYNTERGC